MPNQHHPNKTKISAWIDKDFKDELFSHLKHHNMTYTDFLLYSSYKMFDEGIDATYLSNTGIFNKVDKRDPNKVRLSIFIQKELKDELYQYLESKGITYSEFLLMNIYKKLEEVY